MLLRATMLASAWWPFTGLRRNPLARAPV